MRRGKSRIIDEKERERGTGREKEKIMGKRKVNGKRR